MVEYSKSIYDVCVEKVSSLEDEKFLKMFPDYDLSLDRNFKLEELLNNGKDEKKQEISLEEKKPIEKKRKSWW